MSIPPVLIRTIKLLSMLMFLVGADGCERTSEPLPKIKASVEPAQPAKVEPKAEVIAADQGNENFPIFKQLDAASGFEFIREDDISGQRRIFESTGGGVGVFDYDNDGWLDLVFTGGCKLPLVSGPPTATCAVFRNLRQEKFVSTATESRLQQPGYCQGVAIGDFDNDGFEDIHIAAFGENSLWHNCGDGTFEDVTAAANVTMSGWSTSCAFADVNLDGNLDLYVVNYLKESAEFPTQCPNSRSPDGFDQCPPSKFEGLDDALFLGDGTGGFRDVTATSGLAGLRGKGLGIVISDLDGVAGPEIYVANDGEANFLFSIQVNEDGYVVLRDRAMAAGAALTRSGYAQASMGVAAGDYDENGTIDLFVTNFYGDSDTMYKNNGNLSFDDVTRRTGLAGPSRSTLGWGTALVDLDNDGKLDLVVANGHVEDRTWNGLGEPFRMLPQVYKNEGRGRFVDVTRYAGGYFETKWLGRGLACGDFDRDGRIDLAISHQLDPSAVLINQTKVSCGLVCIRLVGTESNRDACGTKLEMLDNQGKVVCYRELTAGTSFQSACSKELYVPKLDDEPKTIRLTWPTGKKQIIEFPVNPATVVVEVRSGR